jgi:hypothetical protein
VAENPITSMTSAKCQAGNRALAIFHRCLNWYTSVLCVAQYGGMCDARVGGLRSGRGMRMYSIGWAVLEKEVPVEMPLGGGAVGAVAVTMSVSVL